MNCKNCGQELNSDKKFCGNCGNKVQADSANIVSKTSDNRNQNINNNEDYQIKPVSKNSIEKIGGISKSTFISIDKVVIIFLFLAILFVVLIFTKPDFISRLLIYNPDAYKPIAYKPSESTVPNIVRGNVAIGQKKNPVFLM